MPESRPDLARIVFNVLFIVALLAVSLWIVAPFAAAIVWATTIVVATWPVLLKLQGWFGGRRGPATAVMTIVLLAVFVAPLLAGIATLFSRREAIVARISGLETMEVPPPPEWVVGLPLVGRKAAAAWEGFAGETFKDLAAAAAPYARQGTNWLMSVVGSVGAALVQLLLTVIVAAVLYTLGEPAAERVRRFARRVGGERGAAAVVLAGQAIRGIALGVVVTAVGQAALAGIGLAIAGVPFAGVLTVVALVLCIAQVGPILVLLPAIVWLYGTGHAGWGTFLLVWSLPVVTLDNVVRPILIKKGADLPLLLIFAGVLGGLVSFGVIGIFVGPVLLAVSHTLLEAWIDAGEAPREAAA